MMNGIALYHPFINEPTAQMVLNRILHRVGHAKKDYVQWDALPAFPDPSIKVIVAFGGDQLFGILQTSDIKNYHGTVHKHPANGRWLIPTHDLISVEAGTGRVFPAAAKETLTVISDLNTAWEVMQSGYVVPTYNFIEYPTIASATQFVEEYELSLLLSPEETWLSVDIETPFSGDIEEDDKDAKDESWTVERISFTFRAGHAITMPWTGAYVEISKRLLAGCGLKIFWNGNKFDVPRLRNAGMDINGLIVDGMDLFHFLYSDIKKSLGYAAPFFARHQPWKHLAGENMPFYSCMDSLAAWEITKGCQTRLGEAGWNVFLRDFAHLEPTFGAMHDVGVGIDQKKQQELREYYIERRDKSNELIQRSVPEEVRPFVKKGGFKGLSKEIRLLKQDNPDCSVEQLWYDAGYFRTNLNAGETEKPIYNKRGDFNPNSSDQIKGYIRWKYGQDEVPRNKKDKSKETVGNEELERLAKRFNDELLFTIIDSSSANDKLNSFIESWPIASDGRVHPTFSNNPATFRLSSVRPNSQNFPNRSVELNKLREMIIAGDNAEDDWWIVEADYSGIEAIEVGHYANSPSYIRAAKLGVHSIYAASLPQIGITIDLGWSEADLKAAIKDVKAKAKSIVAAGTQTPLYDVAKRVVHGSNYWMMEGLMHDSYPECFPTRKDAKGYQERYFELFGEIRPWQMSVAKLAHEQTRLVNDFGYTRWFFDAMKWAFNLRLNKWELVPSGDAKKAVSTLPQGSAAAIIRRAMLSEHFQVLVEERKALIQIHDSLVARARFHEIDRVRELLLKAMVYPIPEQGGLVIPVETKVGKNWRAFDKIDNPRGMKEV